MKKESKKKNQRKMKNKKLKYLLVNFAKKFLLENINHLIFVVQSVIEIIEKWNMKRN